MNRSIALFDSGFGGLTIMRQIVKLLPFENLIYLADTKNLPFGEKSAEEIKQISLENGKFLLSQNIKLLVIACHSASSHTLKYLQDQLPIPVMGVTTTGQILIRKYSRVAILATSCTIESKIYQRSLFPKPCHLVACPLFVDLIENGLSNPSLAEKIARNYLNPLQGKINAALLACTHFPLMQHIIQKVAGSKVTLLDPAKMFANQVKIFLATNNLLKTEETPPNFRFIVSNNPLKFQQLGKIFWENDIRRVEKKSDYMKESALTGEYYEPKKTYIID